MTNVQLLQRESCADEFARLHQRIAARAYDLFEGRNGGDSDSFWDWLTAEHDVVWKPAIEVREQDSAFTVLAALPGVDAKTIEVDVSPQDIVIKAERDHSHQDKGEILRCEFVGGEAFRSITLPKRIDTANVTADFEDGMLRITAPIAPETPQRRVDVQVA